MKLVRLSSGEEIIGKVRESENSIVIENGYSLIPAGEGKIGFMPFMAYTKAKDGIDIDRKEALEAVRKSIKNVLNDTGLNVFNR